MRPRGLLILGISLLVACTTASRRDPRPGWTQTGMASWYGPGFHGMPTASGEPYDMYALTAAHPSLPFGSVVEVTHLTSGRAVQVRINDRGPFKKRRIIDLSYAAAEVIGLIPAGTGKVEIRLLPAGAHLAVAPRYAVQVAAFRDSARADAVLAEVRDRYPEAALASDGVWHRVRIGPLDDRRRAEAVSVELSERGWTALVLVVTEAVVSP